MAGIYTMQEPKRFDPAGQLAAPLIGVVGTDGQGLSGLEYKYNSLLEGKPGRLIEDMDPAGGQIPGGLQEYQAPVRGDDLVLSIDEPLQYDTEEALARAIVAAQAQSGMALIMDSRTGELLAVAQLTMPTPSEPVTMEEPPALPVWFVPPDLEHFGPGRGQETSGRLAAGRSAHGVGVHRRLRARFGRKTRHHFGRAGRRRHCADRSISRSPTLMQSTGVFSAMPGPIRLWNGPPRTSWPTRLTSGPSRSPSSWA